jgi:hypothetical protein
VTPPSLLFWPPARIAAKLYAQACAPQWDHGTDAAADLAALHTRNFM